MAKKKTAETQEVVKAETANQMIAAEAMGLTPAEARALIF